MDNANRCDWCGEDPLYIAYHDEEWGVPRSDDQRLFEFLVLESAQAGLAWITILRKRHNYRRAYHQFAPHAVARYNSRSVERLMADAGLVRNRLKIESSITNARLFVAIQEEYGSFARYLWRYCDGRPVQNRFRQLADVPVTTPLSDRISRDMKKRGFRFFGSTICYAYMQAVGMVNDHLLDCPRHRQCAELGADFQI